MAPRPLDRLLRQISETETDEIPCSDCFELLAGGVEHELAGAPATSLQTHLAQHLGQCAVCREEYEMLRDLIRSEPADPHFDAAGPPTPDPAT